MNDLIPVESIQSRIFILRDVQVMIDEDLAKLYGVEIRVLNQAVKRNIERFPGEFMFQLSESEFETIKPQTDPLRPQIATLNQEPLRSQIVTLKAGRGQHRKYLPYAFTEQGVAMLSAVLRSETAVKVSIQIMSAFVAMRKLVNIETIQKLRLNKIEDKLLEHDLKFEQLFNYLAKNEIPKKGVFYDGQIFDAWLFVSNLIKSAQKSIILIDNYVDDTVLSLFTKKKKSVSVIILTKTISKQLQLDVKKFNEQHSSLEIKQFAKSHDRFLIIDEKDLYLIGASLKDLGKKWFGFAKMEATSIGLLEKLKKGKVL
jgi:hypothetical protein